MRSRRPIIALAILLLAIAIAIALGSCVTPSIPIPPPEPESMVFDIDDVAQEATFSADANALYSGAIVYIFNRDRGVGIIETAALDGSVGPSRTFSAGLNDRVVITFELESQLASTCVLIQPGRSSSNLECVEN